MIGLFSALSVGSVTTDQRLGLNLGVALCGILMAHHYPISGIPHSDHAVLGVDMVGQVGLEGHSREHPLRDVVLHSLKQTRETLPFSSIRSGRSLCYL